MEGGGFTIFLEMQMGGRPEWRSRPVSGTSWVRRPTPCKKTDRSKNQPPRWSAPAVNMLTRSLVGLAPSLARFGLVYLRCRGWSELRSPPRAPPRLSSRPISESAIYDKRKESRKFKHAHRSHIIILTPLLYTQTQRRYGGSYQSSNGCSPYL